MRRDRETGDGAGPGRRGFLGAVLAGAAGLVALVRGRRAPGSERRGPPERGSADRAFAERGHPGDPWVPEREVVLSPDDLGPSGDGLAG